MMSLPEFPKWCSCLPHSLQEVGSVSVLLKTLKTVCLRVWSHESAQKIDQVRLDITLRMLKTPHFNAKMNALKEVGLP